MRGLAKRPLEKFLESTSPSSKTWHLFDASSFITATGGLRFYARILLIFSFLFFSFLSFPFQNTLLLYYISELSKRIFKIFKSRRFLFSSDNKKEKETRFRRRQWRSKNGVKICAREHWRGVEETQSPSVISKPEKCQAREELLRTKSHLATSPLKVT